MGHSHRVVLSLGMGETGRGRVKNKSSLHLLAYVCMRSCITYIIVLYIYHIHFGIMPISVACVPSSYFVGEMLPFSVLHPREASNDVSNHHILGGALLPATQLRSAC